MEEVLRLALDALDDPRVAVTGRGDRDPGGEVEEEVAVDILDGQPATPDGDDRDTREAGWARSRPGRTRRGRGRAVPAAR